MKAERAHHAIAFVPMNLGLPSTSWWAEVKRENFSMICREESKRMRISKEHHRMGLPMVIGQVDGKQPRTS